MREKENPFSEKIKDFDQRIEAAMQKKKKLKQRQCVAQDINGLSAKDIKE